MSRSAVGGEMEPTLRELGTLYLRRAVFGNPQEAMRGQPEQIVRESRDE